MQTMKTPAATTEPANDPLNATLILRRDLTTELAIVRVKPDSGNAPEFEPGQFIELALPAIPRPEVEATMAKLSAPDGAGAPVASPRLKLTRRAYSIASSKFTRDYVELYLVLVQEGRLTPRIWPLREGERLWMSDQTKGHFTLDEIPRDQNIIAIATGTGAAPFISMIRSYQSTRRWKRFALVHGVRFAADLGYSDELNEINKHDASVEYFPTVTRDPVESPWRGLRGRVQQIFEQPMCTQVFGGPINPDNTHVLLCGNPEMIKSMQVLFEGHHFITQTKANKGNLHFERYW